MVIYFGSQDSVTTTSHMYIIVRRESERVLLRVHGMEIVISVLDTRSSRCKLGIDAPLAVKIIPHEHLFRSTEVTTVCSSR